MKFPVDLLADVSQEQLEKSTQEYLHTLLYSNPDTPERLTLPDSTQVTITISKVGFILLYGERDKPKILALFSPSDILLPIGLYLLDRWWTVEDIVRTADPTRRGILEVDTVRERIVLYILNVVIYRKKEMTKEIPFLCHGEKDHVKILWDDGEAVGFYSAKATGSSYKRLSSRTYKLPVMDSIFVRKCHRGKGFGLLMLKDFVHSFPERSLGLKFPLSNSMYRVCKKYLSQCPEGTDLLWEVESTGSPYQRTNIARKIQALDLSDVSKRLSFTEESHVMTEVTGSDVREDSITEGIKATECTIAMMEETTVLGTTDAAELTATGRRLSESSQSKLEEITDDHSGKSIRIEHIAAGAPREDQGSVQQETGTLHLQTEGVFNHQETGEDASNATPVAEEALGLNQSHRDLGSQDRLSVSPATEEPRDENTQVEHIAACGSPAAVENVTPESQEAKEDPAGLPLFEETCVLNTEVETLKQGDQGQIWKRTTVLNTRTVERKYTQHESKQEAGEETDEANTLSKAYFVAVADTDPRETAGMSEYVFALEKLIKEGRQQLEGGELNNEEQTEKKEEVGVKGTVPEEISAEHPDTTEPTNTGGQLSTEGPEHEEGHVSDHLPDDETEEPPVVQTRGRRRDRRKVCPKPKSTKQKQHKEEGTHTHEAELEAGRPSGRKEADKEAEDNQTEEQNQEEKDQSVDTTREETSTTELLAVVEDDRAEESEENLMTSTEARIGSKEVDTGETTSEMDPVSVPEEHHQTKDGEIPILQHASVILVDLKTNNDHLSAMLASETSDVQCVASEAEEVEPTAAERMDQKPEPASTEEGAEKQNDVEVSGNEGNEESSHQNHEEEEAPLIETIHLRSGRKIVKAGRQEHEHDDTAAVRTCDLDHDEELVPAEAKGEEQAITKDGVRGEDGADVEESAEEASTQPEINEEMRLEEDEAPVRLQPLAEVSERKLSGEDEAEAEKQTPVPPEADEGPVTLTGDQENTADLTSPDTVQASNPEDTLGASEEKQHKEEMHSQGSDLQRVTVVLVDLKNSSQSQDVTRVTESCVDEEEPAAEMEEQNMKETLKEDKEPEAAADGQERASDVPEEAVRTQTPQSVEDDEAEGVSADEEVPVVEIRILRSGRKTRYARTPKARSAAATPQRKSRRAHTNRESEEQGAEDKQMEEENQEEKDQSVDTTREETSTTELLAVVEDDGAEESEENLMTSTEARIESKEVDTEETTSEMDLEKQELADDGAEERDAMTGADLNQPTVSVPEEHHQTKDGEIPILQHASVILVDLKTNNDHLSAMLASETSDVQCVASEAEEVEPTAAERMDQKPEPASTEEGAEEQNDVEEVSGNEGNEESSHQNHEEEEEEAPPIETIHLRSGRKIVKAGRQEHEHDDTAAVRTCDLDHDEELVPAEAKGEEQAITKDGVRGEDGEDVEESAEEASTQPEINEEMRLEEDEAPVRLQPLTEVSKRKLSGEDEAEAEKQTPVPPEADEGPVTLAGDQENTADLTSPDTVQASKLMSGVDEEQPAAEMEEQNMKETLKEDKEPEAAADGQERASDVPEEAVRTQTPQSVEDDEAEGVSADEEVPVVEIRILRSGRKTRYARTPKARSAAATPQRKSRRAHTNRESEEQGAEEPKPALEDVTQEKLDKEGEVKEKDDGVGAAEKEDILQPHSQEEETSRDEPSITATAPRKTKRSAPASSRRKSKRSRMQCESEDEPSAEDKHVEEKKSDDGEIQPNEDKEMDVLSEESGSGTCPNEREENSLRETSSVPNTEALGDTDEEEPAVVAARDLGSHGNSVTATPGTKPPKHQNDKEAPLETSSGPGRPDTEEIAVMTAEERGTEVPEREEEELAEEETTSAEKGMKLDGVGDSESAEARAAESENINDESPAETRLLETGTDVHGTRAGMEEKTTDTDGESPTAEEDQQAEDDAGLSEVLGLGGHQPSAFTGANQLEVSDTDANVESDFVAMETEKDRVIHLELDTDEDEKESNSEEEEEEGELSDDDGEEIVIGKKVLRGRTVPAVIITPQPKARRQPAQRKRKRPDTTPARKSKRRSRV